MGGVDGNTLVPFDFDQDRHVSLLVIAKPLEVPSSGTIALVGGAATCTRLPRSENVRVAMVVWDPWGKPALPVGGLVPWGKRSLK